MANDMGAPAPAPTSAPTSTPSTPKAAPAAKPTPAAPKQTSVSDFRSNLLRGDYDEPVDMPDEAPVEESVSTNFSEGDDSTHSPEEYQEAPAEEEDLSWLDPVKAYKDGVHGIPVHELLQALVDGQLPEALYDKIKFKLKDGDEEWEETLGTGRDSMMLHHNYTRKTQALAAERDAFYAEREGFVDEIKSWKDGAGLLRGMRALGLPIMEAAQILAKELQEMDEMEAKAPGSRAIYEAKQKAELEAEMARRELEHLRKQQVQQKETASTEQQVNYVRSTAARLFKELGVTLDEASWNLFQYHLKPLWHEAGQPNEQIIRRAIQATGQQVAQHLRSIGKTPAAPAQAAAQAKPRVTVGRPVDGGKPAVSRNPTNKGVTPLEFKRRMLNQG